MLLLDMDYESISVYMCVYCIGIAGKGDESSMEKGEIFESAIRELTKSAIGKCKDTLDDSNLFSLQLLMIINLLHYTPSRFSNKVSF